MTLSLLIGEEEHRDKRNERVSDCRHDGTADFTRALVHALEVRLLRIVRRDVTVDIFRHDDAHVAHVADGDGEAREGHDVSIDAEGEHQDETKPDG